MHMAELLKLDAAGVEKLIAQMAGVIAQKPVENLAFVGIRTRGVPLATRLAHHIDKLTGIKPPVGLLDITLYRDDLSQMSEHPVIKATEIPFSLEKREVYLVDDVLYTGRTIRASLDALFDLGRPAGLRLAVLVDRGGRELPIQADVTGVKTVVPEGGNVKVKFVETDGVDSVHVEGLK